MSQLRDAALSLLGWALFLALPALALASWVHSFVRWSWPVRTGKPKYGTSGGVELTDDLIERLADEAEKGYDVSQLRHRSNNK